MFVAPVDINPALIWVLVNNIGEAQTRSGGRAIENHRRSGRSIESVQATQRHWKAFDNSEAMYY